MITCDGILMFHVKYSKIKFVDSIYLLVVVLYLCVFAAADAASGDGSVIFI